MASLFSSVAISIFFSNIICRVNLFKYHKHNKNRLFYHNIVNYKAPNLVIVKHDQKIIKNSEKSETIFILNSYMV